ncbi:hypothetical protein GGR52DRAFT_511324 [Hypoxylon sp. FL1284]|nr:hypothetical protein GGR52DRAFT_511324 [Hypoxylon sp. FL1284]
MRCGRKGGIDTVSSVYTPFPAVDVAHRLEPISTTATPPSQVSRHGGPTRYVCIWDVRYMEPCMCTSRTCRCWYCDKMSSTCTGKRVVMMMMSAYMHYSRMVDMLHARAVKVTCCLSPSVLAKRNPYRRPLLVAHLAPLFVPASRGSDMLIRHWPAHRDYNRDAFFFVIGLMAASSFKVGWTPCRRLSLAPLLPLSRPIDYFEGAQLFVTGYEVDVGGDAYG